MTQSKTNQTLLLIQIKNISKTSWIQNKMRHNNSKTWLLGSPFASVPKMLTVHCRANAIFPMAPSQCIHPNITFTMTLSCRYHPVAIVPTPPSHCSHCTVSPLNALSRCHHPSRCRWLYAPVQPPPSRSHHPSVPILPSHHQDADIPVLLPTRCPCQHATVPLSRRDP